MLPKLISNIILAVIAIFVLYTLAPIFKELLLNFLSGSKKKPTSKNDFDEMVNRKIQQLSTTGKVSHSKDQQSQGKANVRTQWDYLVENDFFVNEQERGKIEELRKSTQWGTGKELQEVIRHFKAQTRQNIEEIKINKVAKQVLQKDTLIKIFSRQEIDFHRVIDLICITAYYDEVSRPDSLAMKKLSKTFFLPQDAIYLLINISLNKKNTTNYIESFIMQENIQLEQLPPKLKSIPEFHSILKKNLDAVTPLIKNTKKDALKNFGETQEDKALIKKKYKKLMSLYHPDKWTFENKTKVIEDRLNENFNLYKKVYEELIK